MKHKISTLSLRLPFILVLCLAGATALVRNVNSEAPRNLRSKEAVQMFAVGQKPGTFSFQAGRDTQNNYLGAASLRQALAAGESRPRNMVAEDFNGDGMSDLVIGYANGSGGVLSVRQGNLQAIAPSDPEVFQGLTEGRYPAPFLPQATLYALPEAPDFLQVGDFNADGFMDVLAAARGGGSLYLLPGDGHGGFKAVRQITLLGQVTAMQANDRRQAGKQTEVALGVMSPEGPKVSVYDEASKGFSGEPNSYEMPAEVNALAFGRLDDDSIQDLAAAAGSEVLILHGRENVSPSTPQPSNPIERASFPFMIKGLATGDFIFDRAHRTELALLSEDGTVYLSGRGELDTRAYTDQEKESIRQQRIAIRRGQQDESTLTTLLSKMVRRTSSSDSAGWSIKEVINTGITPSYINGSQALLQASRISNLPTDDLLVGDAGGNSVKTIRNAKDAQKLQVKGSEALAATSDLHTEGAPLAVLPVRTSVGVTPGVVVLQEGQAEPLITIEVAATYTVDRTDDNASAAAQACTAAANDCSLRGAIIKSNANAGADTILLAAGTTYTLTLGPFDDEFNFLGDQEASGDLDIFDSTSITGGNRDTTIINMGTLVPAQSGINKDRILEVNDFLRAQHSYNVTISNVTLQNGNAPHTPAPDNYNTNGGAIMYDGFESNSGGGPNGTLTLTNCKVTNNTAAGQGGGIVSVDATVIVQSTSIVSANTSTFAAGGGISYNGGNTAVSQNLQINNSTIGGPLATDGNKANDANFGSGGGVQCNGGAGVTISNGTTIQNNVSGCTTGTNGGGGVFFLNNPSIAVSNTTISNNTTKHNGGGIWSSARQAPPANGPSTINLTTVTIQNNQADSDASGVGDGGGIFNIFGTMTVNNTSGGAISGNSAVNGGGIFNFWTGVSGDPSASLTMTNGSISSNSAKNNGGGFAVNPGAATTFGTINVTGTTINNNTANSDSTGGGDGGGVFVGSGNLSSLSGVTIDSNVANSGSGDGIKLTGGTITGAGTINVNGGDSIDLTGGTFTSTSGTLNITGNFTNSGATFNNNGGTFNFNGSTAQTIGGSTAMTFNNLTINNTSGGVSLGNNETVGGALTLTSGALAVGSNTLTLNGAVSATGGSLTSNANGTVNYNQSSAGQAILAANYGNLTFSNFAKTLPNGGTVQIRGTFTTGAGGGHTVTGSTVEFNGTSAQTLPSGFTTYNNLTLNNPAGVTGFSGLTVNGLLRVQQGTFTSSSTYNNVQIDSGATLAGVNATTINVGGNWTNNGTFTANGNTVNFNGSSAQTIGGTANNNFNNLTINNLAGVTASSNQTVNGALTLTNGGLHDGANTLTLNGAVSFVNGNTFIDTTTGGTVIYNQGSNGQVVAPGSYDNLTFSNFNKTLANGFNINISGTFTPGTATGHTVTNNTINFNGAGTQTIPAFTYFNLTSSSTGPRTLASSGIVKIAGTFTPGTNAYTITGSTVEYNGASAQTLPSGFTTYNNLTLNNPAGTTGFAGLTVTGLIEVKAGTFTSSSTYNNVQIDSGATLAGVNATTINVGGNWTNNGTFTANGNTVNFNGAAAQTIGGTSATTFNNLTNANTAGITLGTNATVSGVLALTSSDVNTGAFTLTMPATGSSTGTFDVVGNVTRTGFVSGGSANTLTFGEPDNRITINSGTVPTSINVNLVKAVPSGAIGFPNAVQRTYTITPTGGSGYSATLRLHYLDSELNGNTEAGLIFRRFSGVGWSPVIPTAADTTNNWLEKSGVTQFSPWTFSSAGSPTAAPGTISGEVTDSDGMPLGGVIVQLNGNTSARTITAADGTYKFENMEVNNFYTVTPQRANYSFSPVNRSFSLVANKTDAIFTATPDSIATANPLDTDLYFVRQQYIDFLGREPDAGGLAYWTSEIDKCGLDTGCLNNRRVGIAAAFFIENEYQRTGSFVYRIYKGALGRQLSYNEFSTDRPQVIEGANLEASKTAFADGFVQRAEFVQKYAGNNTADSFVDALLSNVRQTSGADISDQRGALIDRYNSGGDINQSRSLVLRDAIEQAAFKQAEYNPSFVLMEYFGYLKRNPEKEGYDFWLNVLNNKEPNNFRGMVCSFITSAEYQKRFSSVVTHSNQECR